MGQSPEYSKELLSKQTNHRLRSSRNSESCSTLPNTRQTFSDRSFSTTGRKLWNELPTHIKQSKSTDAFKSNIKNSFLRDFYALFLHVYLYTSKYSFSFVSICTAPLNTFM